MPLRNTGRPYKANLASGEVAAAYQPATFDELHDKVMFAQSVELLVEHDESVTSVTKAVDTKFIGLTELDFNISHPRTRFNAGPYHNYGHGSPDVVFSFTVQVTEGINRFLARRGRRNANHVIPMFRWVIRTTPTRGPTDTAANDLVERIELEGQLESRRTVKPQGYQEVPIHTQCTVLVRGGKISTETGYSTDNDPSPPASSLRSEPTFKF